ncbi:MAG: carbamoyl phosphate synthase small subunit, partial [Candidatus Omnitrophica bacterium]|nr:carbamoyl phosphate synthase small subunit [Candidatus Omnitrophota bacterium]
ILVLTYPLIGNYGCAPKFNESKNVWVAGLVIKEKSRIYSNWQAKESFDDFIKRQKLITIQGIDTRTLAVHLRQHGSMLGIISTNISDSKVLLSKIVAFHKAGSKSLLPKISVSKPARAGQPKAKKHIALLDLGISQSILKQLEILDLAVTLLPYNTSVQEILRLKAKGLIISNGPEEDLGLKDLVERIKPLVGKLPILAISTGAQVLARALGAKVNKLKIGHRGVNYPMSNPLTYKGEITVQNHGYVVDSESLSKIKNVKITGYNLNDRTVEEFESRKNKFIGAQYIPASPGFAEVNPVFKKFIKILKKE